MKTQSLYTYYTFGYNYKILSSLEYPINNKAFYDMLTTHYFAFINSLNLSVTREGVSLKRLNNDYEELGKLAQDSTTKNNTISKALYDSIMKKIGEIDNIIDAELCTKEGYLLEPKRWDDNILTKNMDKLFGEGVFEKVPQIAQYDFKEGGLCLAFDRYTATAFHFLRGTEAVLKDYHIKLLPKAISPKGWGRLLNSIQKAIKTGKIKSVPRELLTNLDNLRNYHRNETDHPIRKYTSDEAQDLIGLCIKTINEIIWDLENRKLI